MKFWSQMKRKQLLQEPKTTTEKKIQKQNAEEIVQLVWNLSFGHKWRENNYCKNLKEPRKRLLQKQNAKNKVQLAARFQRFLFWTNLYHNILPNYFLLTMISSNIFKDFSSSLERKFRKLYVILSELCWN